MKRNTALIGGLLILLLGVIAGGAFLQKVVTKDESRDENLPPASFPLPFRYHFQIDGTLEETDNPDGSSSPYWWLNSGGQMLVSRGIGKTIQGKLSDSSHWKLDYGNTNPTDTDGGYHPQNLFRLYTKGTSQDIRQQIYFKIISLNMSESVNRDLSNGIFLISRYRDSDDLYYGGIRVDGTVVIKKKRNGVYHTLAQKAYYGSDAPYIRDTNPNLIPGQKWIGLRMEVKNNPDGSVDIRVFFDRDQKNSWQLALETKDTGAVGEEPLRGPGFAGIRTDFMDVEFDEYLLEEI